MVYMAHGERATILREVVLLYLIKEQQEISLVHVTFTLTFIAEFSHLLAIHTTDHPGTHPLAVKIISTRTISECRGN